MSCGAGTRRGRRGSPSVPRLRAPRRLRPPGERGLGARPWQCVAGGRGVPCGTGNPTRAAEATAAAALWAVSSVGRAPRRPLGQHPAASAPAVARGRLCGRGGLCLGTETQQLFWLLRVIFSYPGALFKKRARMGEMRRHGWLGRGAQSGRGGELAKAPSVLSPPWSSPRKRGHLMAAAFLASDFRGPDWALTVRTFAAQTCGAAPLRRPRPVLTSPVSLEVFRWELLSVP